MNLLETRSSIILSTPSSWGAGIAPSDMLELVDEDQGRPRVRVGLLDPDGPRHRIPQAPRPVQAGAGDARPEADGLLLEHIERRREMVATCFHASTVTHRTRTWNHPPARQEAPPAGMIELRPESWTCLMVAVMRLAGGPDPGIVLGSGP